MPLLPWKLGIQLQLGQEVGHSLSIVVHVALPVEGSWLYYSLLLLLLLMSGGLPERKEVVQLKGELMDGNKLAVRDCTEVGVLRDAAVGVLTVAE